jgi:hypothetical protein
MKQGAMADAEAAVVAFPLAACLDAPNELSCTCRCNTL